MYINKYLLNKIDFAKSVIFSVYIKIRQKA